MPRVFEAHSSKGVLQICTSKAPSDNITYRWSIFLCSFIFPKNIYVFSFKDEIFFDFSTSSFKRAFLNQRPERGSVVLCHFLEG
jgi:hypothetical protein